MENNLKVIVKILRDGDEVINVWPTEAGYCIAVRQKNGEVYVCSLTLDENKNPRVEKSRPLTITFGHDEVEATLEKEGEKFKVITA